MASCIVQLFQKKENRRPFIVLFDSGSSHTFWNIKSLPKGCVPIKVDAVQSSTLAGPMQSQLEVTLEHIVFPEFFRTRQVREVQAKVFNADCRYDAIIGRDMLKEMGLIIDFKDLRMTWDDIHVPMRSFPRPAVQKNLKIPEPTPAEQLYLNMLEADLEDDDTLPTCDTTQCSEDDYFLDDDLDGSEVGNDHALEQNGESYVENEKVVLKESKYEGADVNQVVHSCTHLNQQQQNELRVVLEKFPKLFDNTLGKYTDERIHLDLKDDAVPYCQARPYAVLHYAKSEQLVFVLGIRNYKLEVNLN
jgi:hypothetical protein